MPASLPALATPRLHPYWWEGAGQGEEAAPTPLPARADVAVVGAGYTGLAAALALARGGCRVAVLEAKQPGYGASTRNGGMVSGLLKHSFGRLARLAGADGARRIFAEAQGSVLFLEQLIAQEAIACDYRRTGMYVAAYTPAHYRALAREAEDLRHHGIETTLVPPAEQGAEIGSDYYHGGRILHLAGGLHPARLHRGLLERCRSAGVGIHSTAPVTGIQRSAGRWRLQSPAGTLCADALVVATNGYTGPPFDYHQRRVIPIASHLIATEALPDTLARCLIPGGRMVQDTKKVLFYFRMSPDGRRLLFGGRASFRAIGPGESAPLLHQAMGQVFPALRGVRISHAWSGNVAFTFDALPHLGCHRGIHYSLGYCGQGVALSIYLGNRLASGLLGRPEAESAFRDRPFPTRPLYHGRPWFLPLVGGFYRWLDRLGR